MKWGGFWAGAAALAVMMPGCGADEGEPAGSSLEQAAPLHVELRVDWQDFWGRVDGKIQTSLLPEHPDCALQDEKLRLSTGGESSGGVRSGEVRDGTCGEATFSMGLRERNGQRLPPIEPTEIMDALEIWDDPDWKVRIIGVDIFQDRAWHLWQDVEPRTRLGGHWSHPQDELAGRIRAIWYEVIRDHDNPEKGSYRIQAEDIEVDGSYFEFTIPGLPVQSQGKFRLEVEDIPLRVECENASCQASLSARVYVKEGFLRRP